VTHRLTTLTACLVAGFLLAQPAPGVAASAATKPSATSTPIADKCPLHAVSFMLIEQGLSGHVDRYAVALLLDGTDPVQANLEIPGLENDIYTPVIGPDLGGRQTLVHYVIDIPRAVAPRGVRVLGLLLHGRTESALTCHSPAQLLSQAPAGSIASFDDTALSGSDLLFLRPVTEARVLQPASAAYPADDERAGHHGIAVVGVTVGARGTILGAYVFHSSGYPSLDASALSAAKHTVYSAPQFNGAAIPLDYLVTYSFGR
jgi:TonB family protein